ncbi:MAG TPA: protease modulator HflK [Planctomycetaceae bacterium]|nr:protease modulator HflK [Planctomycetaceae bacterium]
MKRKWPLLLVPLAIWLVTGFYVVRGNERGIVLRFGRMVVREEGVPIFQESGWHYNLPWPWGEVERVNLNAVRTLTIGIPEPTDVDPGDFLKGSNSEFSAYLTGDKNILNLQIVVQYRISERSVDRWLYAVEDPGSILKNLAESVATDLVSQSGVDFVHPLGLAELRNQMTVRLRNEADQLGLGVEIDEAGINAVYPPLRVKAYFVDVANARTDQQKYVNAALAYEQQRSQEARSEDRRIRDRAETEASQLVQESKAAAESFRRLIAELEYRGAQGTPEYRQARAMALQQYYLSTIERLMAQVKEKLIIDAKRPADVTIFGTVDE